MDGLFEFIYIEGDLLKTVCSMFLVVLIFEFVLTIICIIKSAYKSVVR